MVEPVNCSNLFKAQLFERILNALVRLRVEQFDYVIHVLRHEGDLELQQLDKPVDLLLLDDRKAIRDEGDGGVFSLEFVAQIDKCRRGLKLIKEVSTVGVLELPIFNCLRTVC